MNFFTNANVNLKVIMAKAHTNESRRNTHFEHVSKHVKYLILILNKLHTNNHKMKKYSVHLTRPIHTLHLNPHWVPGKG